MSPGEYIREELKRRGWGQADLANVMGRPTQRINELVLGKASVSPEVAVELAAALGGTAEDWLQREAAYRLSLTSADPEDVRRRARLYGLVPVKELQKRGWINATDDIGQIEKDILRFLEIKAVDDEPNLSAVMRRTDPHAELTPAQRAWCFRVRQLARCVAVAEYREDRLPQCERELRRLAAYSQETRKVPGVLAKYGIRYVVVEPLPGIRVDGMVTWLDTNSPVIGMSLRFDRIDGFWHTLCHEVIHIKNRDELSVDEELSDPSDVQIRVKPAIERRADEGAAAMLIDPDELNSFIVRVGPLYSKDRINQFANRIKIHPGIIVGQLQHRAEIGYHANREMLVKVRHVVAPVALTDGWGTSINPKVMT